MLRETRGCYLCSVQLYGGVCLPKAASAHLPNLTQTCLGQREVATHQVGHDLKHTHRETFKKHSQILEISVFFCHFVSPVELPVEQGRALKPLLLFLPPRCLIGPLWAESPATHTAAAATAGRCPLPPACEEPEGSVWPSSDGRI